MKELRVKGVSGYAQCDRRDLSSMGDTGLEQIQKSRETPGVASHGAAESGAVLPCGPVQLPVELKEIIAGWCRLPAAVQMAILAIVRAS
jgi:hypothetical protein